MSISTTVALSAFTAALQAPATAPLLPVTTAADCIALDPQLVSAVADDIEAVRPLLAYLERHAAPVRIFFVQSLLNCVDEVGDEALDDLLESTPYGEIASRSNDEWIVARDQGAALPVTEQRAFKVTHKAGSEEASRAALIDRFCGPRRA